MHHAGTQYYQTPFSAEEGDRTIDHCCRNRLPEEVRRDSAMIGNHHQKASQTIKPEKYNSELKNMPKSVNDSTPSVRAKDRPSSVRRSNAAVKARNCAHVRKNAPARATAPPSIPMSSQRL